MAHERSLRRVVSLAVIAAAIPAVSAQATPESLLAEAASGAEAAAPATTRYVCDLAGRSTTWQPFQYTNQLDRPEGPNTYWYARYVIEGTANCTRTSSTAGVELLSGRLRLAGEAATGFAGNGQPRWDPQAGGWDRSANEASWGWLTEFYGAHNRFGWDSAVMGGSFYQGPFVPEHATIAFPDGTSIAFGYFMRSTNESLLSSQATGEEKVLGVFPTTGPPEPTWFDGLRGEGGQATLRALDGRRAFSARDTSGVTLSAQRLKLGPSVSE